MMQIEYKCCGAIRFEDWRSSFWFQQNESLPIIRPHGHRLVPDSCCITITANCGKRDHPSNIPYTVSNTPMLIRYCKLIWFYFVLFQGCIYRFTEELRQQLVIIGAIGLGICSINVIGMILACCLFAKLSEVKDWRLPAARVYDSSYLNDFRPETQYTKGILIDSSTTSQLPTPDLNDGISLIYRQQNCPVHSRKRLRFATNGNGNTVYHYDEDMEIDGIFPQESL